MADLQCSESDTYKMIQLSLTCLSGVDRTMLVPTTILKQAIAGADVLKFGATGIPRSSFIYDSKSSFGTVKVDPTTIRPLPWLSIDRQRVGGAICELAPPINDPDAGLSPRTVANRQLARLKEKFGLTIKSAFEAEFMIFQKDGVTPFNNISSEVYGRTDNMAGKEETLLHACRSLEEAGLPMETFMTEFAAAQFEITFRPQEGMASADSIMIMKEGLRASLSQNDMAPTFMACPTAEGHANGFHFNHSLWTPDGINACLDLNDPILASAKARHWIAGLVYHAPALTALFCPTINCYRRLSDDLSPTTATWGEEDRSTFVRLKTERSNVYLENRLPSSACNPYLALAGTVAAGMDGLNRQLECPPQNDPAAAVIPKTMEEAVAALEKNTVLTEYLGPEFVEAFLAVGKHTVNTKVEFGLENLENQRKIYFHCI